MGIAPAAGAVKPRSGGDLAIYLLPPFPLSERPAPVPAAMRGWLWRGWDGGFLEPHSRGLDRAGLAFLAADVEGACGRN